MSIFDTLAEHLRYSAFQPEKPIYKDDLKPETMMQNNEIRG